MNPLLEKIKELPISSRPLGCMVLGAPQCNVYQGILELRNREYSTVVYFMARNIKESFAYDEELSIYRDECLQNPIVEGIARTAHVDRRNLNLTCCNPRTFPDFGSAFQQNVFEMLHFIIRHALIRMYFASVRRHPGKSKYTLIFKPPFIHRCEQKWKVSYNHAILAVMNSKKW